MPTTTLRLYFQPLCQHEVFGLYQHCTQTHFARVMLTVATIKINGFFSKKRRKIVEIFALLTTEISSYKMCKVGMLFCIL